MYPESFLMTLKRGAAMIAKSLICVWNKLHSLTKDLTIFMFGGGWEVYSGRVLCLLV
jgi:hypothetical protein